jgi:hypothetical protein
MVYKIRINCTTQQDLTIDSKKINKQTIKSVMFEDYINKVYILYEDNFHSNDKNFINKTLEFYTDKLLTEEEFKDFINNLKFRGFISKRKEPKIQMFDDDGDIIYNYDYNNATSFNKKKVKAIYYRVPLYLKKEASMEDLMLFC